MTTPTTPHVLASDQMPALFRPGNQAVMEPTTPANFCPSQEMMPGMGQVRSGSPVSNGLVPASDRAFEGQWLAKGPRPDSESQTKQLIVTLTAQKQMADQTGDARASKKIQRELQHATKRLTMIQTQKGHAIIAAKAADIPIWQKNAVTVTRTASPVPLGMARELRAPLRSRPAGVSGLGNFLTDTAIPFVPNWALLASAGALSLVIILKKRK